MASVLLYAAPARALTVRVDWAVDALPIGFPLQMISVRGTLGVFEIDAFPALVPLDAPFSARATPFGPAGDDVYTFESPTNLAFEFSGADPGLRAVGASGYAAAHKLVCNPGPPPNCGGGQAWSLTLRVPVEGGPATLLLADSSLGSGWSYTWSGTVRYGFTFVPEPSTLGLVAAGLLAIGWRRHPAA